MTVWVEAEAKVTVNGKVVVPVVPTVAVPAATVMAGRVSVGLYEYVIVPVAEAVEIAALPALARSRVNVLVPDVVVSPLTGTVMVWVVTPGAKVSTPPVAV